MKQKPTKEKNRSLDAIRRDPLATLADIAQLTEQEALAHPNCPSEVWWALAAKYPDEAEQSALFALLTLEEPRRWEGLTDDGQFEAWINRDLNRLTPAQQELFAADCAERVLPVYKEWYPKDKRPREAIRVRRLFATGDATQKEWNAALGAARDAAADAGSSSDEEGAAENAARASFSSVRDAALFASYAAGHAERWWQWGRLQTYLDDKK